MFLLFTAALAEDPVGERAESWTLASFELPKLAKPLLVGQRWQARITTVQRKDGSGVDVRLASATWRLSDNEISSSLGLSFSVTGLPAGATFDPETRLFEFTPRVRDVGHNPVQVTLSYAGSEAVQTLDLAVVEEPGTWLMPGAGYTLYAPSNAPMFHGASVEYLFARFVQPRRHQPGLARFYGRLDLLTPVSGGRDPLLVYALGLGLSFERGPVRPWFVPNFGVEVGGLSGMSVRTAFVSPVASVHVYARHALTVGVDATWMVPLKFERFDDWMGFRGRAFLDVSLW
jgi:hypothetical protein